MKKEYLQGVSDANLIQMYCNVVKTYFNVTGHAKNINLIRHNLIVDEMDTRGIKIASIETIKEKGILNGEGTF